MEDIDKAEQEKIVKAIVTAFDKYAKRYNERLRGEWESKTPEEKNELRELVKKVDVLLSNRAFIPGFYRYVLKKVMNNRRLMRQRRVLIKAFMISMLNPKGVRIKDVIDRTEEKQDATKESELPEAYTRRNDQRIFYSYYQDAFFKPERSMTKSIMDDRFTPFSSVFAPTEPPVTPYSNLVSEQYSAVMNHNLSNESILKWLISAAILQSIIPEALEDMQSFRDECKEAIEQELRAITQELRKARKTYLKEELARREKLSEYFLSEVSGFSPIFLEFYYHFASILAWEWFRGRRPENRKSLLARGFPLRYSALDIVKARQVLLDLTGSEDHVNSMLAAALQKYAFVSKSFSRFKECLESSGLRELDCGIVFENIATLHRGSKSYRLMRLYLKSALEHYEKAGDPYRICVTLKNMGEAKWYLGFKNKALKLFDESEKRGKILTDLTERSGVLWNLACAFRRMGEVKSERNYLMKCLEILPETETDKILHVEQRLQQLDIFF